MNLLELIAELKKRDIKLSLADNGKVHFAAPEGTMTPDLVLCIKRHKQAVLDMILQQTPSVTPK